MSLLEQDTIKKRRVDNKTLPEPEKNLEFEIKSNKKYEVEAIIDNTVYDQQANSNQMPDFYYLVV